MNAKLAPQETLYNIAGLDDKTLQELLLHLPKHRIEQLRKNAAIAIKEKYGSRNGPPKYGNLPRTFARRQVVLFFDELWRYRNKAVYAAFCLQFFYGLRIGELSGVTVVPGQQLIKVDNFKCKRTEFLPVIDGTEILFTYLDRIKEYSPDYLRKYFRETCERLGDEFMFRYTIDRRGLTRRQFATHTLRKTAGNMLRIHTGDPYKTSVFLRHNTRNVYGATAHYMHYDIEDMRHDLEACFNELVGKLIPTCIDDRK